MELEICWAPLALAIELGYDSQCFETQDCSYLETVQGRGTCLLDGDGTSESYSAVHEAE